MNLVSRLKMLLYQPLLILEQRKVLKQDTKQKQALLKEWAQLCIQLDKKTVRLIHSSHLPLTNGNLLVFESNNPHHLNNLMAVSIIPLGVLVPEGIKIPFLSRLYRNLKHRLSATFYETETSILRLMKDCENLVLMTSSTDELLEHTDFREFCLVNQWPLIPVRVLQPELTDVLFDIGTPLYHEEYCEYDLDQFKYELSHRFSS